MKLPQIRQLVSVKQNSDPAILERLYRDYECALRSFLLGRVRSRMDIDDIVQEVFLRLSRQENIESRLYESGRRNKAYLFTAANNLIVDMERHHSIRRRYHENYKEDAVDVAYELSPDVIVGAIQELDAVKDAIKALPEPWRYAFLSARFKGSSRQEISAEMGVSTRQVENYIAKALMTLRKAVPSRSGSNE